MGEYLTHSALVHHKLLTLAAAHRHPLRGQVWCGAHARRINRPVWRRSAHWKALSKPRPVDMSRQCSAVSSITNIHGFGSCVPRNSSRGAVPGPPRPVLEGPGRSSLQADMAALRGLRTELDDAADGLELELARCRGCLVSGRRAGGWRRWTARGTSCRPRRTRPSSSRSARPLARTVRCPAQ